jgi:hypothetical protein
VLRFKCPKCANIITADEAQGKEVTPCPKCGLLVRLKSPPAKAAPPPPASPVKAKDPVPEVARVAPIPEQEPASVFEVKDASESIVPVAKVAPRSPKEADTDAEPPREPGRRRRKKRRRRKADRPSGFSLEDVFYLGGVGFLAVLGIILTIVSVYKPSGGLVVIGYGTLIGLVGVVWLYVQAMEDGVELVPRPDFSMTRWLLGIWLSVAVLLMFVTAIVYMVTNPVRAWKPGIVAILGLLFETIGFVLLYNPPTT